MAAFLKDLGLHVNREGQKLWNLFRFSSFCEMSVRSLFDFFFSDEGFMHSVFCQILMNTLLVIFGDFYTWAFPNFMIYGSLDT